MVFFAFLSWLLDFLRYFLSFAHPWHVAANPWLAGGHRLRLWASTALTKMGCQKPQLLSRQKHPVGPLMCMRVCACTHTRAHTHTVCTRPSPEPPHSCSLCPPTSKEMIPRICSLLWSSWQSLWRCFWALPTWAQRHRGRRAG